MAEIYILFLSFINMAKQKKGKKEERKEIKVIRVIKEEPIKEIKNEEKKEEDKAPDVFEDIDDFISPDRGERPVSILNSGQVQNLEQDLAMVPSITAAREEENNIKYGDAGGYGKMGYGDFNYEVNKNYNTGMEGQMIAPGEGRGFTVPRDMEAERVRNSTRSAQDKAMDYSNRVQADTGEEEKKKKRVVG